MTTKQKLKNTKN